MPLGERHFREAASETEYTVSELVETAERLEEAIQDNLHDHFRRCRLSSGYDYWIMEDDASYMGVWLALNGTELVAEMEGADWDGDVSRLLTVASANLRRFRDLGITIETPGALARAYEDPYFYPIYVQYPDGWEDGRYHTNQRFDEYITRYDLSPAEALDYWFADRSGMETHKWAAKRGVQPEAVRKNIRQAKEKLGDEEKGASHRKETMRAVPRDEPEEFYDEERDVYYQIRSVDDDADSSDNSE